MNRESIEMVLLKSLTIYSDNIKSKGLTYHDLLLLIAVKDICRHELSADNANLLQYGIFSELKDVFGRLVKSGVLERVSIGSYILTSRGNNVVNLYIRELSRYIN